MSNSVTPPLDSEAFVPGGYSVKKGIAKTAKGGGAGFGLVVSANYLAPIVLDQMKRMGLPIPPELTVGVMAGGLVAGFVWWYDYLKFHRYFPFN